jgi:hypothetical protein
MSKALKRESQPARTKPSGPSKTFRPKSKAGRESATEIYPVDLMLGLGSERPATKSVADCFARLQSKPERSTPRLRLVAAGKFDILDILS